jgi:5-methylcytosine-specific restriction protein A
MGEDYIVDPEKDLVTICANCHAMVHRRNPPLTIDELKRLLD